MKYPHSNPALESVQNALKGTSGNYYKDTSPCCTHTKLPIFPLEPFRTLPHFVDSFRVECSSQKKALPNARYDRKPVLTN